MVRYIAAKNKINIGKAWSCMEWEEKNWVGEFEYQLIRLTNVTKERSKLKANKIVCRSKVFIAFQASMLS